jgi:hypothetical protein
MRSTVDTALEISHQVTSRRIIAKLFSVAENKASQSTIQV